MTLSYWTTTHFKALQKAWYQRLEESGFEDAEVLVGHEMELRQTADHDFYAASDLKRTTAAAYYQFVSRKVQETVFTNDIDRIIMSRHAEGAKQKAIVDELASLGIKRVRETIRFKIRVYEMKWGIRSYTPRQLNRRVS